MTATASVWPLTSKGDDRMEWLSKHITSTLRHPPTAPIVLASHRPKPDGYEVACPIPPFHFAYCSLPAQRWHGRIVFHTIPKDPGCSPSLLLFLLWQKLPCTRQGTGSTFVAPYLFSGLLLLLIFERRIKSLLANGLKRETCWLVIAPMDPCSTQRPLVADRQSQSCLVLHHRCKKRRFSANSPGILQYPLSVVPNTKPILLTPSPSLPPSSSRLDEEDKLSVISERLCLKTSNNSSTAAHGRHPASQLCTYEDWQDIEELCAKATEQYNSKLVPNISNPPTTICSLGHSLSPCCATRH